MSDPAADRPPLHAAIQAGTPAASPLKRRGLLLGAGAVGAAALAAKVLPGAAPAVPAAAVATAKAVDPSGGYQVTDHVLRYYETTRA